MFNLELTYAETRWAIRNSVVKDFVFPRLTRLVPSAHPMYLDQRGNNIMILEDEKITVFTAYKAMFKFLDNMYELTKSDGIGDLLGGMSLLEDGGTADPAAWNDWLEAIEAASQENYDIKMRLTKKL